MKNSMKLLATCLLIVPLMLAFNFNGEEEVTTLYELNEKGEISIIDVDYYKGLLEAKFQEEEGKPIKIDKITAGEQAVKDGFVRRVFTASSPDLEESLSVEAIGVYNSSNPEPIDIDYICTKSIRCTGCDPYWTGTRYRCTPCGAIALCWGHKPIFGN